jgi:hypothetical protein
MLSMDRLRRGSWFMVHGSWFMVHGSWFMVCKNRKSFPVRAVNSKMLVLTLFYMRNEPSNDPVHIPGVWYSQKP